MSEIGYDVAVNTNVFYRVVWADRCEDILDTYDLQEAREAMEKFAEGGDVALLRVVETEDEVETKFRTDCQCDDPECGFKRENRGGGDA